MNATLCFGRPPVPAAEQALHQAILSSPVRVTLRGHSTSVHGVAFSPDGKRLATASAETEETSTLVLAVASERQRDSTLHGQDD